MLRRVLSSLVAIVISVSIGWAVSAQVSAQVSTQEQSGATASVSGHGKTAFMGSERMRRGAYDGPYQYSPAIRAGDYIFVSGVVAGAYGAQSPLDRDGYKASVRQAFEAIQRILNDAGASMNHIVKLQTFHVFDSPWVTIDKTQQGIAVAEVKGEFMGEPHTAWTAVGTTSLLTDVGLVEIDVIAYAPQGK